MKIEAVILDWAGTAVDFGCFAPVNVFLTIFEEAGVTVTLEEARKPMGMLKIDHIRTMLEMARISEAWEQVYGRAYTEQDVQALYAQFETKLMASLALFTDPIPHVRETVQQLRQAGIRIGSTTGYTKSMMEVVTHHAAEKGYKPDYLVTPTDVGDKGRPYPYMIFRNIEELGIQATKKVVKVGDTTSDMQEALNAGVWAVGVIIGSSEMGLTEQEFMRLSAEERADAIERTKAVFEQAGAHYTIQTMQELPALIKTINARLV
ncbi:phosphonoacetaldehyde hydrolase [Lysinibacillus sp. JNUCC-52]|uniref:phosphonoacetaldehyde hydrolase n=1 Tax=Lysinibacillus sp. JNUCC-52 TaxID=2792480 RepID=UPI001938AC96|nr:phosphonoacetaldehyde hydrolase [Lysinibacillus sp. JNUCC-52]